jgi:hypothetical protein
MIMSAAGLFAPEHCRSLNRQPNDRAPATDLSVKGIELPDHTPRATHPRALGRRAVRQESAQCSFNRSKPPFSWSRE